MSHLNELSAMLYESRTDVGEYTCTATHCNTLQRTAAHCNALLHTATHCCTLLHTTIHCSTLQYTAAHCNTLHYTAAHCNTPAPVRLSSGGLASLPSTATHCNTLQHTATHRRPVACLEEGWHLCHAASPICDYASRNRPWILEKGMNTPWPTT